MTRYVLNRTRAAQMLLCVSDFTAFAVTYKRHASVHVQRSLVLLRVMYIIRPNPVIGAGEAYCVGKQHPPRLALVFTPLRVPSSIPNRPLTRLEDSYEKTLRSNHSYTGSGIKSRNA